MALYTSIRNGCLRSFRSKILSCNVRQIYRRTSFNRLVSAEDIKSHAFENQRLSSAWFIFQQKRTLCAPPSDGLGGSGEGPAEGDGSEGGRFFQNLPAAITVPDEWPDVPIIVINRNPVFPRFIKVIEV